MALGFAALAFGLACAARKYLDAIAKDRIRYLRGGQAKGLVGYRRRAIYNLRTRFDESRSAYAAGPAKPGHAARADEQLALLTV